MIEKEIQEFSLRMKKKSDQMVDYFLAFFFITGLLFSFYYDTWIIALGIGSLSLIAYYTIKAAFPSSNIYQYVLSVILGVFTAQFIYQLHGLFEMHFFAFIGSAFLIIYRNWKLQIPLAIVIITHHAIFGYLQYTGSDEIYFSQLEYMPLATFALHILLAAGIFFLCGLWAHKFRIAEMKQTAQSFRIGKLQEASEQKEVLIAMSESLKASNEKLRKAHDELQSLFENIEEVFFSMQVDVVEAVPCFTLLQMSPACSKVYGYRHQDFFNNTVLWKKVVLKEDQHIIDEHFNLLEKGIAVTYEHRIRHISKSVRWVETKITPTLNSTGLLVRIDGFSTDITERKLAEKELHNSFEKILAAERLMKSTEAIARFGSWQFDLVKEQADWSDEVFSIYGFDPGEYTPSYELFLQHLHPDDLQYVKDALANAVQNFSSQKLNFRIIDKTGNTKYAQAELVIERTADGSPIKVSGFIQDVTEKNILENRLAEEKKQKQQQITEAVIIAQERERLFLGEELHDNINPILATVKLYIDCAIKEEDKRVGLLKESKDFINAAMDEIRVLSRSLVPPSLKEIGLKEALMNIVENVKRANNLQININWSKLDEDILSEKLKLTIFRIVQEQLTNIFKHAEAKTVTISLTQEENKIQLSIDDDGIGFDIYKKRRGVGLQNISSRADLFNGEVIIDSYPGNGCRLLVNFHIQTSLSINA